MAKKVNTKLLISLVLVLVLIICAVSMIACNKKKGDETNGGTSVSAVVGTTTMSIDNKEVVSSGVVPTYYTKVTLDTTKYTKMNADGNNYFSIVRDETSATDVNGTNVYTYYIYDEVNGTFNKSFNYYVTRALYVYGENSGFVVYRYLFIANVSYNSTNDNYVYTGGAYDYNGNAMFKEKTNTSNTLFSHGYCSNLYDFNYSDYVDIDDSYTTDIFGNRTFTAKFYNDSTDAIETYIVNIDTYQIEPYSTTTTPSYSVGNKYIEKTEVPGLSGYYYYESKSTNSVLFYNSFTASAPTSSLSLDFGNLEVTFDTSYIIGGKVFIYGSALLPESATDYDFCSPSLSGTVKGKTSLFVYDIASGSLNQILKGYQIDDKFKVFSANNKKAYIAVEICGISEQKIVNPTSMYFIVDADGNFVVSTPELFDTTKITKKLDNGYYIYEGSDADYLLDNCLNTVCYINNLAYKSEKALISTSADNKSAYFMDATGKISYVATISDYSNKFLFGDYIIARKTSG